MIDSSVSARNQVKRPEAIVSLMTAIRVTERDCFEKRPHGNGSGTRLRRPTSEMCSNVMPRETRRHRP